jgi:Alw26I/Eco31I/Esp3I family type II restriction m6 adenine DNA methyltransferase
MQHVELLASGSNEDDPPKSLTSRATGRFYTHEVIGRHVIDAILAVFKIDTCQELRVVDPFCGDGRLVCWLLRQASETVGPRNTTWHVTLWDCSDTAVRQARQRVEAVAREVGLNVIVEARLGDSFTLASNRLGEFNIVITNPPWELLKPDRRELSSLDEDEAKAYVARLRSYDEWLAEHYPLSQPRRRFSGWGTNLSRCGSEVALRLTAPGGVCGLVSPASFLADQITVNLRRWLLREYTILDLGYFPAEARFFEGVDQPAVTLVAQSCKPSHFAPTLSVYGRSRRLQSHIVLRLDWEDLQASGYALPVHFGADKMTQLARLRHFPKVAELEGSGPQGLWAGRELDETNHHSFLAPEGDFLFVKGRMIGRYQLVEVPTLYVRRDALQVPRSACHYRVAWRDVSRPNQKRRVHATLIPPGWVSGNSLSVAFFRDDDVRRLKALLAILNSIPFEFQLRSRLATAHLSLGAVRRCSVPDLEDTAFLATLSGLVDRRLAGDGTAEVEAEVRVAEAYGLSRDDLALLLSSFDKMEEYEVASLTSHEAWR